MRAAAEQTVADVGERALIARIADALPAPPAAVTVGIGDDAAVIEAPRGALTAVTTDTRRGRRALRPALHPRGRRRPSGAGRQPERPGGDGRRAPPRTPVAGSARCLPRPRTRRAGRRRRRAGEAARRGGDRRQYHPLDRSALRGGDGARQRQAAADTDTFGGATRRRPVPERAHRRPPRRVWRCCRLPATTQAARRRPTPRWRPAVSATCGPSRACASGCCSGARARRAPAWT